MSFGDHLEELRRRVLLALLAPLPLAIVLFVFSDTLIEWLRLPVSAALRANGLPDQLQVLSPTEMIMLQLKLSLIAAFVLSAPWVLYQAWKFIEPGLYSHEKRFVHLLVPMSALLTVAGVLMMYYIILPLMLRVLIVIGAGPASTVLPHDLAEQVEALMESSPLVRITASLPQPSEGQAIAPGQAWLTWPDMELHVSVADAQGTVHVATVPRSAVQQLFRMSEYINLVLMMLLAVVIAFQMPLVVMLMGWMGLASPQWLREKRRYALMICAVIAVVITPPDAVSMILMLIPLYALYELGILLLVLAPASAVAEGRVFSLRRRSGSRSSDNAREPMDAPRQSSYLNPPGSHQVRAAQRNANDADSGERSA